MQDAQEHVEREKEIAAVRDATPSRENPVPKSKLPHAPRPPAAVKSATRKTTTVNKYSMP